MNKEGKVIAKAPAKINLVLDVKPLVEGQEKHKLLSVFCTTTLADTLVFDFIKGSEPFNAQVSVDSTDFDVSFIKEKDNIVIKVVEQFKLEYGFGFLPTGTLKVQLIKSIPTQAGLGGGSSDAAAMLRMLCWLAQVDPLSERSLSVAQKVGADVPFFLHAPKTGLCALMEGYGDELIEELPKPLLSLVLVKPDLGVPTKKAFARFDKKSAAHENNEDPAKQLALALKQESALDVLVPLFSNNLEPVATTLVPEIAALKEELCGLSGVLGATMCGSGSAIFAVCENPEVSKACVRHFAQKGIWTASVLT